MKWCYSRAQLYFFPQSPSCVPSLWPGLRTQCHQTGKSGRLISNDCGPRWRPDERGWSQEPWTSRHHHWSCPLVLRSCHLVVQATDRELEESDSLPPSCRPLLPAERYVYDQCGGVIAKEGLRQLFEQTELTTFSECLGLTLPGRLFTCYCFRFPKVINAKSEGDTNDEIQISPCFAVGWRHAF